MPRKNIQQAKAEDERRHARHNEWCSKVYGILKTSPRSVREVAHASGLNDSQIRLTLNLLNAKNQARFKGGVWFAIK